MYLFYLFFYVILFFEEPLCGVQAQRGGCTRLYRLHALSLPYALFLLGGIVFKREKTKKENSFQVCIEKHSSHSTHVDLEWCISPPSTCRLSLTNGKRRWRKKTLSVPVYNNIFQLCFGIFFSSHAPSPSFPLGFLFTPFQWMLSVLLISPSTLMNGCYFMWDVRAGKPIECSVYIKSHSFHDYKPLAVRFWLSVSPYCAYLECDQSVPIGGGEKSSLFLNWALQCSCGTKSTCALSVKQLNDFKASLLKNLYCGLQVSNWVQNTNADQISEAFISLVIWWQSCSKIQCIQYSEPFNFFKNTTKWGKT